MKDAQRDRSLRGWHDCQILHYQGSFGRFEKALFKRLIKYKLRVNPNKCIFGASLGKFLGFIVRQRGIKVDPAKVQAIRDMLTLQSKKQIRSFQGKVNYIARFIEQLTATCDSLFKLLKKDTKIEWKDECQTTFDKIKQYLLNPYILVPLTLGYPLILYLVYKKPLWAAW